MKKIIPTFLLLSCSTIGSAASICSTDSSTYSNLEYIYKAGKIRVFYSTNPSSPDNLPIKTDINNNSIPDYVENVALQANTAADVFTHIGFVHPLESTRYKNVVNYIDIHLVNQDGGVAYEIPAKMPNRPDTENKCSLKMVISNRLDSFPGEYWSLVSHELFHLYQYGYSQFKRGWYGEATANWAERSIRSGGHKPVIAPNLLPATQEELKTKVYDVHYNGLWSRIAELYEKNNGVMGLPSSLLNRKYTDGSKVIKDDSLSAYIFMAKFMDNLRLKSEQISYQNNWDPYAWGTNKTLESNNPIILKVIQDTMYQSGMNKTEEEKAFLNLK